MKHIQRDQKHQMSILMEKVVKYRNKAVPNPDPDQFISITKAEIEFQISRFKIESAVKEGLIRTKEKPGDKKTNYLVSKQDLAIYMMSHDFLQSLKDSGYLKEEVDPVTGRSIWKEISLKATKKGIPDGYVQWAKLEEVYLKLKEVFGK